MKKLKNLAKNNRQHGKVNMLKAARSTLPNPLHAIVSAPKTEDSGREEKRKIKKTIEMM